MFTSFVEDSPPVYNQIKQKYHKIIIKKKSLLKSYCSVPYSLRLPTYIITTFVSPCFHTLQVFVSA